jgi:hypothetical protein
MKLNVVVDHHVVLAGNLWVLVVHIKHQHLRQHQQLIVLVLEVEMLEMLVLVLEVEMLEVLVMPSLLLMASYF